MTADDRPDHSEGKQDFPKVISGAVELLMKFSIPLYVDDMYGRPEQFGTGFFVRAENINFLVSAAHVLDVARSKRVFFYAAARTLRSLTGRAVTTGDPDRRDEDLLDVGVIKLTGEALPPFPDIDKYPMDISYLKPRYRPRSGKHYVIVGFPATKSRVDTKDRVATVAPYAYRSDSVDESEYAAQGLDAETHLVLPLNLKKGFDPAGQIRAFPKPQGMSGSPIVVLYEEEGSKSESRVFPVVAVGTRYRKESKVLIGTDVQFVVGAIERSLRGQ